MELRSDGLSGPDNTGLLLALGWASAVLATYLGPYQGWVGPIQLWVLAAAAVPELSPGPYLGTFLLNRLHDAGIVLLILVEAWGVGALVIGRLTTRRGLLESLYAVGAGLWMLAVGVLILGAWSTAAIPLVLVGLGAWLAPLPRSFVSKLHRPRFNLSAWDWFLVSCLAVALLSNLPGILTPPFEYDALEYHLGAPAEYLQAGQICYLPHNFYSNLPQLTEMLYLLVLTLTTDIGAKLLHASLGVFTAAALVLVGARLGLRRVGLTAAVLFYCVPFIQYLSQTARIDLATGFYGVLALGGLVIARSRSEREAVPLRERTEREAVPLRESWIWLVALACGGAVATKWTAIPVLLIPVLVYLAAVTCDWRGAVKVGGVAALLAAPWLIKNWVLAGNPVYPLFSAWLPHADWGPAQAALFARKHYAAFDQGGWQEGVTRLWHYSFKEPGAVPVLLMTIPLLMFGRRAARGRALIAASLWLLLLCWAGWYLGTFRPWRFLVPLLPLAALLGAWAIERTAPAIRWVVGACLVFSLVLLAMGPLASLDDAPAGSATLSPASWVLGQVDREEFVRRFNDGTYSPISWMNQHLPAGATVLYLGEARVYHGRHPVRWSTAYDHHPIQQVSSLHDLRSEGITHVYVNYSEWKRLAEGYDYLRETDPRSIQRFLEMNGRVVFANDWAAVYEL